MSLTYLKGIRDLHHMSIVVMNYLSYTIYVSLCGNEESKPHAQNYRTASGCNMAPTLMAPPMTLDTLTVWNRVTRPGCLSSSTFQGEGATHMSSETLAFTLAAANRGLVFHFGPDRLAMSTTKRPRLNHDTIGPLGWTQRVGYTAAAAVPIDKLMQPQGEHNLGVPGCRSRRTEVDPPRIS